MGGGDGGLMVGDEDLVEDGWQRRWWCGRQRRRRSGVVTREVAGVGVTDW